MHDKSIYTIRYYVVKRRKLRIKNDYESITFIFFIFYFSKEILHLNIKSKLNTNGIVINAF